MLFYRVVSNEIMKLFNNGNTKFTHLDMNTNKHLINFSGAENCFSELKSLWFAGADQNNSLTKLARISKSVKTLEFFVMIYEFSRIIEFIEAQNNLKCVKCHNSLLSRKLKAFEESLIKHADTIQYLQIRCAPITKFLSNFVNLICLEICVFWLELEDLTNLNWSYLENTFLPVLKILKVEWVPPKSLAVLIENTKEHLTEISIEYEDFNISSSEIGFIHRYSHDSKKLIKMIYQKCRNLNYLLLHSLKNDDISEFEELLIKCQCLNELKIIAPDNLDWDTLFKILAKSSPTDLFKFTFRLGKNSNLKLESLKLFFDSWKDRNPMLLHTTLEYDNTMKEWFDLFEKYKTEGIIKDYYLELEKTFYY